MTDLTKMSETCRTIALELHTDLANLKTYRDNSAIVVPLVMTIEEKMFKITTYLAELRNEYGMRGSPTIVNVPVSVR